MLALWILCAALVGGAVGALAAYLFADRRCQQQLAAQRDTAGAAEQRAVLAEQKAADVQRLHDALQAEHRQALDRAALLQQDKDRAETRLEATRQNLDEQRRLLDEARRQLTDTFAGLSREALKENADTFLTLARQRFATLTEQAEGDLTKRQQQIETLIKPLRETLEHYQTRLAEIEQARVSTYSDIRQQLGNVTETQRLLGQQTSQLVTALSRPGTRGQWGELTLRRLLELAGMSGYCDFDEQISIEGDEGRQRPDLVVRLPGERVIIVDSKYSADDFLKAANCENAGEKRQHLTNFAKAVRRHATQLGQKKYQSQFASAPEFVVMFLPGEALIYAATEQDPALIEDAFRKDVIIATPTTLVALLKTIAQGWREAEVEKNIEEVKSLGGEMIDRIATFAEHFAKVGQQLDNAVQTYNKGVGSMEKNLMTTARKMAALGAPAKKTLPEVPRIDAATRVLSIGDE